MSVLRNTNVQEMIHNFHGYGIVLPNFVLYKIDK